MKIFATALPLTLLALASASSAQGVKSPTPLTHMPDVKTCFVAPVGPIEAAPARELPANLPAGAALPPKVAATAGETAPGFAPDFSRVRFDEPGDGALWVRGRTYKARFDEAGATYIPALGSRAPRNFPLAVGLASLAIDGQEIALDRAAPRLQGEAVTLDRGVVREIWHMGLESAEQTFVFDTRPQGDVELGLAFESELEARATDQGVAFEGPHGGVRITSAVAIDAAGQRLDLATRVGAGRIVIDLPSAFSAAARYPLVIDPVYSTYVFDTSTNQSGEPDIANSGSAGTWCAVYQYYFSATDVDAWAQDVYYGQPVAGTGMWVDYTSGSWYKPRIAYNALHDTFVTVSGVAGATWSIQARAHYAHTTNQLAQVVVQANAGYTVHSPDVGGDPALVGPTYFFVVWTRIFAANDSDIHGRLLDWNGTPLGTSTIPIENSFADDSFAQISKTDGHLPYATQRWNVTWVRHASTTDIFAAQINWDGAIATAPFAVDATAAVDSLPAASSLLDGDVGPRPWMVNFVRQNADFDIMGRVLVDGTTVGALNVSVNEYGAIFEDQTWPDVDTNGQRFVMSYSETYQGGERDLYVTTMSWDGTQILVNEPHVNVDYSTSDTVTSQISGCMNATSQGFPYYGLAWPRYGTVGDVYVGAYYESALVEATCFGDGSGTGSACPCGNSGAVGRGCANSVTNGAFLYCQGSPWMRADDVTLTAYDLPSTSTCLFFQGTGIGNNGAPFGDGLRCIVGTVIRIGTKTAVNGVATYPEVGDASISVKGLLPADGGYRGYQAWYRNAAVFCTASTFNVTSGTRVIWVR